MASKQHLDLIEGACLVLISNGISHGYQLAKQFESGAALGEVLTLSRPVIYRTVKSLEAQKLIRSVDSLGSRGQLKFNTKVHRNYKCGDYSSKKEDRTDRISDGVSCQFVRKNWQSIYE